MAVSETIPDVVTGSSPVLTTAHSEPSMAFLKSNIGGTIKVVTAWRDSKSQVSEWYPSQCGKTLESSKTTLQVRILS
jgi:hypothetical protein